MTVKNFRLNWKGDDLLEDVRKAAITAENDALEAAVDRARGSHPSWNDRSGETQASIRVIRRAALEGGKIVGAIGSRLRHFIYLEIGHHARRGDRTIYRAVQIEGQDLDERIRRELS